MSVVHDLAKIEGWVRLPLPAQVQFSIMLNVFMKMRNSIRDRVVNEKPGLYLYLIFPMAFAFLLTFMVARILNILAPDFYLIGLAVGHVHHFVYGFFVLAVSGYLALIFDGPRAKFLIALLHGFGLGLTFDEYDFWLRLVDDNASRWSYDGFVIVIGFFFLILSAKKGVKMLRILWPF